MTTNLDSIRLYIGVATFATSAFTGMLLMSDPKQRFALTLIFATSTILLMWKAP